MAKSASQLQAENDRTVRDDVLSEMSEELRQCERFRRTGEIVIRVGVCNGRVTRVNTETSRTKVIGGKTEQR